MNSRSRAFLDAVASAKSWADIHTAWASKTEKEKGDRFEDLTQAYLQITPEYSSKLKHVWRLDEVPSTTRQKLKLPATDKGIDLVAETHEGEFWAIQCKYRQNTDQQLTHTDISTFTSLTFQACKGFSFALVCSTTERVTSLYRGEERIGFCALDVWQGLDQEFFNSLRNRLTGKEDRLDPRTAREHQTQAVKDGVEHFIKQKATRGKLIMPCGTGKSLTAWFLSQALKSKRIVIAVPSLSLVRQTLKVWLRESVANNINVEWICVCSDETAGKADQDDVVVQRQDIAVPCLTSSDKIADWLKVKHKGLTVVFTTYQSGEVLATAARKAKFVFDLGIMDEAHKTVGDGGKQFSILLHDHNVEISKRIFMTATERRYKGSSDKVLSMDNIEVYGDTFHQLSFKQAMEAKKPILCDYNIITIGVSRQEMKELIQKNVFVRPTSGKWDEELEADMLAAMVALRKAMKEHPIKHAVSFHGSIQRAQIFQAHNDTFTQEFPEFGNLQIFHVSGQTPTGTRSNIIKTFAKAERSLITNARCLTEGVDVPGIDCVLFADPRKSTVDIVQAVGRALRPSEGKKLGYVILPVLHDTDATSEQMIESGAFKEVLSTLSALAANDDRIIEYFRGISQGRNPSGSSRVRFELGERIAERIDINKLVYDLEIKCWNRLAKLSWRPFEEAREFIRNIGLRDGEWNNYCQGKSSKGKKPADIPYHPDRNYAKQGWMGMGDWLGTGTISAKGRQYRNYEEAKKFVHSLGLKNWVEWRKYCRGEIPEKPPKPKDIPLHAQRIYLYSGWKSTGEWLGTGNISASKMSYRSFTRARLFARSLGLKSKEEWRKYTAGELNEKGKLPFDIPADPRRIYLNKGWKGFGDWIGTGRLQTQSRTYLPFEEARKFIRKIGLKNFTEWSQYSKGELKRWPAIPKSIPSAPNRVYKGKGWINLGDWLGTMRVATQKIGYRPFESARNFARLLKLKSGNEWFKFCHGQLPSLGNLPSDIPVTPRNTYKEKGWKGWKNWLGTQTTSKSKRKNI
jgi:superfamily II DNA or RNA helicase